jgi:hypothetical protein
MVSSICLPCAMIPLKLFLLTVHSDTMGTCMGKRLCGAILFFSENFVCV